MKRLSRTLEWNVLNQDELTGDDLMLVNAAKEATAGSWSPYSGFKVGAALLLDDGTVVTGSNQENAIWFILVSSTTRMRRKLELES